MSQTYCTNWSRDPSIYDGEAAEVVELQPTTSGVDVTLRIGTSGQRAMRISMRELLDGGRARIIGDDVDSARCTWTSRAPFWPAFPKLRWKLCAPAPRMFARCLTGYRSGHR